MYTLTCKNFEICYGMAKEILRKESISTKYVIAQTYFTHTEEIARLFEAGFCFHDRCLQMEIGVSHARESFSEAVSSLSISESACFTDEMFEMACAAFALDRRFQLEPDFEPAWKIRDVIEAAVAHYQTGRHKILCAECQGNPVGCVLIRDMGGGVYENVLGFTKPGIAGKVAAIPLYIGALELIKACGGKRYAGTVSSTNMGSLNLHMSLGAKVVGIIDRYILRKREQVFRS